MALTQTQVSQLYVSIFGRASEGSGNVYWQTNQPTMAATAAVMLSTAAAKDYFGATLNNNQAFIEHIYQNTLGKTIATDPTGIAYWVAELAAGKSKGEVVASLINAAQSSSNAGAAQEQFNNKVLVSNYAAANITAFTTTAEFMAYIDGVDSTLASVASAKAEVDADVPAVVGNTFTLTAGTDRGTAFTGTANNDFFDAPITQNSWAGGVSNSLSTADRLDGGAGTDTLYAELVPEFFGVTGDNQMDVQPQIQRIEDIQIEAMDVLSAFNTGAVVLDAKNIADVVKIGSSFSDGDLTIENLTTLTSAGTIRNTEAITVTMDHTDDFNHDANASDLTVLFDEDYLLSGQSTSDMAYYFLEDREGAAINPAKPLNNINTDGLQFTVDGVAKVISLTSAQMATFQAEDGTWAGYTALMQAALANAAKTDASLTDLTLTLSTTIFRTQGLDGTTLPVPAPAIVLSSSTAVIQSTGFHNQADAPGQYDVFAVIDNQDQAAANLPITVNVELDKVGRDGEGGNLTIGGKNYDVSGDFDVDQADGIHTFNITVNGDEDRPSNLGQIISTNGALRVVNIASEVNADADATYAALTVRGEGPIANSTDNPFGGTLTTLNANAFKGDLSIGQDSAALNVDTFTATGGGDVIYNANINGAIVLSTIATPTAPVGTVLSTGKGVWTNTTGAGADKITVLLDGDAVDTVGTSFAVNTGSGIDTVTINMTGEVSPNGVSQNTMSILDNLTISTGADADRVNLNGYGNFKIDAGSGDDYVHINSLATGNNGNAVSGAWTFGQVTGAQLFGTGFGDAALSARVLYKATLTLTFAGIEQTVNIATNAAGNFKATQADINTAIKLAISSNPELAKLLTVTDSTGNQAINIVSTVGGLNDLGIAIYQPQLVATSALVTTGTAAGVNVQLQDADLSAIRQGLIDTTSLDSAALVDVAAVVAAVDNNATTANLFSGAVSVTGAGNEVAYSTKNISHDVTVAVAADAGTDIFDAAGAANYYDVTNVLSNGGSTNSAVAAKVNFSTVNLGLGNDLVVLHSDLLSANIVKIDGSFGKDTIVNFHDVSPNDVAATAAAVGNHALEFTFLDNKVDPSALPAGNAQSANPIAVTVNNVLGGTAFADSVAGSVNVAANSVNILRFIEDVATPTALETWAGLTDINVLAALNSTVATSDWGNIGFAGINLAAAAYGTTLVGLTQKHILMIENGLNQGEYKVYELTSTLNTAGVTVNATGVATPGWFTGAKELGVMDFGSSINVQVVGSDAWEVLTTGYHLNGTAGTALELANALIPAADGVVPVAVDTVSPLFATADVNGSTLVMHYTEANTLDAAHAPAASAFAVSGNTVTAVTVDGAAKTVSLTLGTAVVAGATVTVGYTDPTTGNDINAIQDAAGNDAATILAQAVTNNTGVVVPTTAFSIDTLGSDGVSATSITNTQLNALTGAFNYTDNVATRGNVDITGFGADDVITITGATSAIYDNNISVATNGQDVEIAYNNGGQLNLITLVGVANGGFINNVASFNALAIGDIVFA